MSFRDQFIRSSFLIKLRSWEYWPFGIVQFPIIVYFIWLSIRSRSLIFFSASNPGIPMGGMFGESKFDVLKKIPENFIPKTILIPYPSTTQNVLKLLQENGLAFPLIFKPDLGERGFMVKKIRSESDIDSYLGKLKFNFIAQELVDLPLEFGVFYTRFPSQEKGAVTSVVMKEMLTITGDGRSTMEELILNKDRAKLQWNTLKEVYQHRLSEVLENGKIIELVSIGNHCLGTKFLDGSQLINKQLSETFDHIGKKIEGFYFGRFDLRCNTLDDLYGGNIKIMELNGCGAEPAHIYHPGFSLRKALGVLFRHWHNIFVIARENEKRGIAFVPFKDAIVYYRRFKSATA